MIDLEVHLVYVVGPKLEVGTRIREVGRKKQSVDVLD